MGSGGEYGKNKGKKVSTVDFNEEKKKKSLKRKLEKFYVKRSFSRALKQFPLEITSIFLAAGNFSIFYFPCSRRTSNEEKIHETT